MAHYSRFLAVLVTSKNSWHTSVAFSSSKSPLGRQWDAKPKLRTETLQRLTKEGKLEEAIKLVDSQKPRIDPFMYNSIIGVLAGEGNVKAAFKTYNRMKKHGLKATERTYANLFTACASNQSKQSLLELQKLITKLSMMEIEMNQVVCNAAIRALAKHRMTMEALDLLGKMDESYDIEPDARSFTHALEACGLSKSKGITLADFVWRNMKTRGIRPDLHAYNQYAKAYEESGEIGSVPFGSVSAFLGDMKRTSVKPDIRTFHLLNSLLNEDGISDEIQKEMSQRRVKPDVAFTNTCVKRRAKKGDLSGAWAIVHNMVENGLRPDSRTYQALSVACQSAKEAKDLLDEMKMAGVEPNKYVYGTLLGNAAKSEHKRAYLNFVKMKRNEQHKSNRNDATRE